MENFKDWIESEKSSIQIGEYVRLAAAESEESARELIPYIESKRISKGDIIRVGECLRLIALGSGKSPKS